MNIPCEDEKTFWVMSKVVTEDLAGSQKDTWIKDEDTDPDVNGEFVGKLDQLTAFESQRESRDNYIATQRLFCDTDVLITQSGRLIDENDVEYDIISYQDLHEHHKETILSEVTN